jgi:hypothetical protein
MGQGTKDHCIALQVAMRNLDNWRQTVSGSCLLIMHKVQTEKENMPATEDGTTTISPGGSLPGIFVQSVVVDLLGLIEFQVTVNKRQTSKGWAVHHQFCHSCEICRIMLIRQLLDGTWNSCV